MGIRYPGGQANQTLIHALKLILPKSMSNNQKLIFIESCYVLFIILISLCRSYFAGEISLIW